MAIQDQYHHDYHRLGEPYAHGDRPAREQMKNITIYLQADLNGQRASVDLKALQFTLDRARTKTVMVLGQSYQRMAASCSSSSKKKRGGYKRLSRIIMATGSSLFRDSRSTSSSLRSRSSLSSSASFSGHRQGGCDGDSSSRLPSPPSPKYAMPYILETDANDMTLMNPIPHQCIKWTRPPMQTSKPLHFVPSSTNTANQWNFKRDNSVTPSITSSTPSSFRHDQGEKALDRRKFPGPQGEEVLSSDDALMATNKILIKSSIRQWEERLFAQNPWPEEPPLPDQRSDACSDVNDRLPRLL